MLNAGPNVTFHKLHLSMLRQLELISTEIDHYMTHAFSKYFEGFYTKSEYRKIRTRNNSVFGHFSRNVCKPKNDTVSFFINYLNATSFIKLSIKAE